RSRSSRARTTHARAGASRRRSSAACRCGGCASSRIPRRSRIPCCSEPTCGSTRSPTSGPRRSARRRSRCRRDRLRRRPDARLRPLIWLAAVGLVATDVVVSLTVHAGASWVLAVNDLELVALAVFVTNMLVQSGMRARDLAFVVSGLAVYDVIATTFLGLMGD